MVKQFRCPGGLRVWSAPRSGSEIKFIFREIFEDWWYERHGVTIRDGDVALDIGANVGLFALSLMERFDGLSIVCLEPVPLTRACLERNIAESRWRGRHQVTILADAAGSANADAMITYFSLLRTKRAGLPPMTSLTTVHDLPRKTGEAKE